MIQSTASTTNWRRIAIVAGIIVLFVLALWFAARIPKTMTIFVIAAFLASAVHPIAKQLERRRVPRPLAIMAVFTVLLVVVIVGIVIGDQQSQRHGSSAPSLRVRSGAAPEAAVIVQSMAIAQSIDRMAPRSSPR